MVLITRTFVIALLIVCTKVSSQTADINTNETTLNELVINVVAPELKPLVYNADKVAVGLLIDTLNKVSEYSSLKFNVTVMPWGRAMLEVKNGHADAIMPTLYTNERAQSLVFPPQQFVNFYGSVLIKKVDNNFEFDSFDTMTSKKSVAKVRSVLLGEEFEKAKKEGLFTIAEVSRLEDAFNMLLLDRVDLVVTDGFAAYTSIKEMGIEDNMSVMSISSLEEPSFIAFSPQFAKKHDVIQIMSIIDQFNNPDRYKKILSSH
ncbi:hypothetical protein NBRC116600_29570 [Thalassotalea sp. SU-HH00458]